ncbi:hypothetical protein [Lacticaseibacillus saniviri]|uniref:hypothetical protein n=1 Tax=Lacticaseibacillus saniviri TaxID=931533 RepID=UPI000A4C45FC|nr:hypothetical protein [Lacticaseibacillus saniviri]
MQLTDQFKENYEYNGGQDIQAFLLASKKAYQCLNDLVTRMSAMPDKVKAESVNTLLVQQLDQTTFAESEVRQWEKICVNSTLRSIQIVPLSAFKINGAN